MVANRTAQLAEMLAEDGKPEGPAALIEGLASVVDPKRGKETYGELCQFYFTLRHGGADRDAALARLSARYGSPGGSDGKIPRTTRRNRNNREAIPFISPACPNFGSQPRCV